MTSLRCWYTTAALSQPNNAAVLSQEVNVKMQSIFNIFDLMWSMENHNCGPIRTSSVLSLKSSVIESRLVPCDPEFLILKNIVRYLKFILSLKWPTTESFDAWRAAHCSRPISSFDRTSWKTKNLAVHWSRVMQFLLLETPPHLRGFPKLWNFVCWLGYYLKITWNGKSFGMFVVFFIFLNQFSSVPEWTQCRSD